MKRALITGIKGFTGRYVATELQHKGWEVWGTGAQEGAGDLLYRRADLLDLPALRSVIEESQPHVVVHLAAIAFVAHGDAEAFYNVNLLGTRNLLAALAEQSVRPERVLLASSANVYGNATAGVLNEAAPPNPTNDYAVSKLAMEYMARLWMDKLPIVITRPFNYTGVGQTENFLLPKIVSHFRRRAHTIELGNLDVSRDFSDVRAVAKAYCGLLEVPSAAGQTVNVCSGQSHSLLEIIALAEKITGHTIRVSVNPAFVRANEVKTLYGDASNLKGLIGHWESQPLEETLRWMFECG